MASTNSPDYIATKGFGGQYLDYITYGGKQSLSTVSGHVTNQAGDPVDNATVQVTTVDTSSITTDQAYDRLDNASEVTPDSWDPNIDVRAQEFEQAESNYVALTTTDISGGFFALEAGDLGQPDIRFDSGEQITVSVWDPTESSGFLAGEYESQLPGTPQDEATVTFEQLSATGETVQKNTTTLNKQARGSGIDAGRFHYGTVTLNDGFYRVSTDESPHSYVIAVGNPARSMIRDQLEDIQGQVTERAQWVQDQVNSGPLGTQTVTTNESGYYSADVGSSVTVVGVQSYKASSLPDDPENLTVNAIRGNASDLDGSVYMPSRAYKYDVPTSDADVTMYEVQYPQFGNLTDYQDKLDAFLNKLKNEALDELPPAFQQALSNIERPDLEQTKDKLEALTEQNEQLRDRFESIAEDRDINVDLDTDDASREELNEQIAALRDAIEQMEPTVPVEPVEPPSTGDGTISRTWAVDGDVTDAGTIIRLDFANGTTKYLNATDSEYVIVDSRVGRTDLVTLDGYPLGENDPATVSVTPTIATAEGVGEHTDTITNPTFDGEVPELRAIDVSTFQPETGESVSLTARPKADSSYANVTKATVYAPDGSTVSNTVTTDGVEFTPEQTGVHKIRLTFQNTGGTEFTETVTLRAVKNGDARPPSIRAISGPTGTYALAGSGLRGGDITVSEGGAQVDVTAISNGTAPSELHVYSTGLSTAPDTTYQIAIVEGDSEAAVSRNIRTYLHGPPLQDADYVYRQADGDESPLPRGKSDNGIVDAHATNSTIQTYTSNEGSVSIRINSDPSTIERIRWFVATNTPDLPDVGLPGMVDPFAAFGGVPA